MKKVLLILLLLPSLVSAQVEDVKKFEDYNFPFNFSCILGTTKYAKVGNEFNYNYYPAFDNSVSLNRKVIIIGGIFKRIDNYNTEKTYYAACYHNREFYIEANDVEINDEFKSCLDTLASMSDSIQGNFWQWTKDFAKIYNYKRLGDIYNLKKAHASYGLSVLDWGFGDASEYTEGTSVHFRFLNPTKKRIKYIYVNLYGTNRVGDRIYEGGKSLKILKFIGPIEPGNIGSVSEDYVWFTDLVEHVKITSIKVQYMDGTIKPIKDVGKIIWDSQNYNYLEEDGDPDLEKLKMIE